MFKLIKTKNNQRFYKLDEPIKYIEEDLYTAKKFWEEFHERITKIKINGFPNGYKPSSRTLYDEYNQETIPDFIEYIIISDGIDIKESSMIFPAISILNIYKINIKLSFILTI